MLETPRCPSARRDGALALTLIAAVLIAGCGRRGELEPPPDASAVKPAEDPLHPQARKPVAPITPPKQPFILDPLL